MTTVRCGGISGFLSEGGYLLAYRLGCHEAFCETNVQMTSERMRGNSEAHLLFGVLVEEGPLAC